MKTVNDPRHQKRQQIVQKLFAYTFQDSQVDLLIQPILENLSQIDSQIEKIAPEFVYEDDSGIKSVGYTDLIVAKMASLEEKITILQKEVKRLKRKCHER